MRVSVGGSFPCRSVAADIPGAEGPVTDNEGRLWCVAPSKGEILRITENGERQAVANTGGMPAGLQLDSRGLLWIADMRKGILSLAEGGEIVAEVSEYEGEALRGCNDLSFDLAGNLYFTAPAGSSAKSPCGEAYCRLANGKVRRLDEGFAFCNGIAVSANGKRVIVAETFTRTLWTYELSAPGEVSVKKCFAVLPGTHRVGPDGIEFDAAGNLIATNYGEATLDVFGPGGNLMRRIALPFGKPSNLHFAGPDSTELYVTEHDTHAVWRLDYGMPGQFQPGWTKPVGAMV